jgi:hypothetical protein
VLNGLEEDGVIRKYAIAGAMAFLFYTEPARTYDLDVFVFLPPQEGLIFSMEPLYDELRKRGYSFDAEHVMIAETPVQFLLAYNPLAEEAVEQAVMRDYTGVPVRVVRAEYLAALSFQTGGRHRLIRAEALLEDNVVNEDDLEALMIRHGISRMSRGDER